MILLRTQRMKTAITFLALLVIEDLRKLLGVELVRNMGIMMSWVFVFWHVLYVEDCNKVILTISLKISVEKKKYKMKVSHLLSLQVSWACLCWCLVNSTLRVRWK